MAMWSDFSTSQYLSSGDFAHREERKLTVESIRSELVGRDRDNKPVLYFRERDAKPLILNRANQRQLAACGPSVESCIGASVVLHVIDTEFSGEAVRGIRIRSVTPPAPANHFAPNARERAQQAQKPAAEMDDEIPF